LTTFSTFSAEGVLLLQKRRLFGAVRLMGLHVCGSLFSLNFQKFLL
jgi:fluoride ion exporter CrcB/FEX